MWINADGSTYHSLLHSTQLTPFEIAVLQDGSERVIQTALFNLWHRQLITIHGLGKTAIVKKVPSKELPLDNDI